MPDDAVQPIMPTGSGVADLEIAREQDALIEAATPITADDAQAESEAHPS